MRRHLQLTATIWLCSACTVPPDAAQSAPQVHDVSVDVSVDVSASETPADTPATHEDAWEGWNLPDAAPTELVPQPPRPQIHLRWIHSYPGDSQARATTGLRWALSALGAHLPPEGKAALITWESANRLHLDIQHAGLPPHALLAFDVLCQKLRNTEEYKVKGAIDVGRFLMLTLGTSAHYYRITGVPLTYAAFKARHPKPTHNVHVTASLVAHGDRQLMGVDATHGLDIAWVAVEGSGQFIDGSFTPIEYETLDMMPNGQPRFAVYGLDGTLRRSGSPKHGVAGKPARCMWCHESTVQRLWLANSAGPGGLSDDAFNALTQQQRLLLQQIRTNTPAPLGFDVKDEHTQMELLYVAFMEPTVERLALEWGLSVEQVQWKVAGLRKHQEPVYAAWTQPSLTRSQIDSLGPYKVLRVPTDPLEPSAFEPDYLAQ